MRVDAIVNTANPAVAVGRGVDEQIYNAAGWTRLFKERVKIGPMRRGSAAITRGFKLPAKYITHTVGPNGMKLILNLPRNSSGTAMTIP